MIILTIDIGIKNLAIAYALKEEQNLKIIDIDLFTLNGKNPIEIILELKIIFMNIFNKYPNENWKIYIEKQINKNVKAFGIMYGILGIISNLNNFIIELFDPINKFSNINVEYNSNKKEHKKLSIEMAKTRLIKYEEYNILSKLDHFNKKDDISDCINMIYTIVYNNKDLIS